MDQDTKETMQEETRTETAEHTEADDYAAVRNEKAEKAEVIETTAKEITPPVTPIHADTNGIPQPEPSFEQQETALSVLQDTRDLMKKQVKQGRVRTICAIAIAVFIAIGVIFGIYALNIILQYGAHVMEQLDKAMGLVSSIEDLVHQISKEIDALNLDAFNATLSNLDTITGDIAKATTAISDATTGITDAVKELGKFTEGLKNLNPVR